MFGLFRKKRREAEVESCTTGAEPHEAAAPLLPDDPASPDAAFAAALGLEPAALAAVEPPPHLEEGRIAAAVAVHFDAHRPGPASFPAIALQIVDLVRKPDVELSELARVIGTDPALSAGVLILANSPVYRGVARIETVRDAVARLGLDEVARLAAALSTRSLYRADVRAAFEIFGAAWNRLFYHAATVARAASELARMRKLGDPDRVFLAGMLHDVGKSIALRSLAALVMDGRVAARGGALADRVLHRVHVKIGEEVHLDWGLPPALLAAAVRHHDPALPAGPDTVEVHLVRLVSALQLLRSEPEVHPAAPAEVVGSARALGLGPARVEALARSVDETGEWVRMIFGEESGGPAAAR